MAESSGHLTSDFPMWLSTSEGNSNYRLTIKPTEALALWQRVLDETKNTLDKKVNALGLSEATVQQRKQVSDSQLLIQMPGVDDTDHIKQILQTAAVLELYGVQGGPYATRDEALSQNGGVVPAGSQDYWFAAR